MTEQDYAGPGFTHTTEFPPTQIPPATPNLAELFKALAVAQGAITAADANQENTHFDYKYADLSACLAASRKPLSDNGLAVIQLPKLEEDGTVELTTVLAHESGQYISSVMYMTPDKPGPQALGSCITYLRRYTLCAMVGISQVDDDGKGATNTLDRVSPEQVDAILILADELFGDDANSTMARLMSTTFAAMKLQGIADLPAQYYDQAVTSMKNRKKRLEKGKAAKVDDSPDVPA